MLQPGRHFLGLSTLWVLGMLLLPRLSSAQVVSQDPNFTPSVLKSGLSGPSGLVFRSPTGDLAVPQNGANQISLVNASSGGTKSFAAQTYPQDVAVRANDGLVAVRTQVVAGQASGPIDFYSSTGTLLGSIAVNQLPAACVGGLVFDSNGNLYVAAGPALEGGSCDSNGWALYEFEQGDGTTPSTPSSQVVAFFAGDLIGGLAFASAPLPSGTLYAISSSNGNVYEISVACFDCGTTLIAQVTTGGDSPVVTPSGIAIDPLSGDIYISEFTGPNILRMPPPNASCDVECLATPSTFATGFSNTFGLAFDTPATCMSTRRIQASFGSSLETHSQRRSSRSSRVKRLPSRIPTPQCLTRSTPSSFLKVRASATQTDIALLSYRPFSFRSKRRRSIPD